MPKQIEIAEGVLKSITRGLWLDEISNEMPEKSSKKFLKEMLKELQKEFPKKLNNPFL